MATKKVQLRERRKCRIRAKISGTAQRPRLVVFRSLTHIYAQVVDDQKGKVIAASSDLKETGKETKVEKAKKVGATIAKLAQDNKIETVVFDRNGFKYHGRVKALADAARESGLKF